MNANVMKTNNGKRLLAAVAIFAMVVCVFAAMVPADVDGDVTASVDNDNPIMSVSINGTTTNYYATAQDEQQNGFADAIVAINSSKSNVIVSILQDFELNITDATNNNAGIWINNSNATVVINGNNNTITANNTAESGNKNVLGFAPGSSGSISNITIDGSGVSHHGINIVGATVSISNVTVENNGAAGIVVNGGDTAEQSSTVNASNITTSGNAWGGINVDSDDGSATFTLTGTNSLGEAWQIWSEDSKSITAEGFTPYSWTRTGETADGKGVIYLQNSTTSGDFVTKSTDTITVGADQTLTINGTMYNAGAVTITKGGEITVDGYVKSSDSAKITETGFTNNGINGITVDAANKVNSAFSNEIDTVILTGDVSSEEVKVPDNKTLIIEGKITGGTVTVQGEKSNVIIPELTNAKFTIKNSSTDSKVAAEVEVENLSGKNVTISYGSVVIGGEGLTGTITVKDGTLELAQDTTVDAGTEDVTKLTIKPEDNETATVTAGDLVLNGDLVLESGISMTAGEITGAGTITVESGAVFEYASKSADVKFAGEGTIKITGAQGTENIISVSQSVNGTYYLTADTTILEGVTLTVPRNAVIDLMGYDLTVEGTLVVENRGTVTSSKNTESNIVLTTTGAVQNEGTIGDKMTINIANGEKYDEANGKYTQVVSMMGVTGVSFELVRSIDTDNNTRVYDMAVSGDVSAVRGVDAPVLTLNNVNINKSMTVGRDITFNIAGTTNVTGNGTVFTFDGEKMVVDDATNGTFTLYDNGTSAVINGHVVGKIDVRVGVMDDDGSLNETGYDASVTFKDSGDKSYIVGMTISVQRVTVPQDEGDAKIFQRMFVNGELKITNDDKISEPAGTIDFGGEVYITETLAIPDKTTVGGTYTLMVSEGGVVSAVENDKLTYNGVRYEIDGEKTTDPSTFYYTTFAAGMEALATTADETIYLNGNFTITGTYTVGAELSVDILGNTLTGVVVGEGSAITVDADGYINPLAFKKIEGKVTALEGDGYAPAEDKDIFAVKAVDDETLDTTYSGFKTAMDEAQAGQTITVVGNAEYDGDLVIPNGVTVQVNETKTLTVTGDVTIENGGKLVLDASTLAVGEIVDGVASENTVTVAGELDASENGKIVAVSDKDDSTTVADVDVYSTGKLTSMTVVGGNGVTMNAAYYQDGEYVYTSLANAVAYAEENALPYAVHVTGVFTETGAVESDGVDIEVDDGAKVTLGDLRLNDAKIALADRADKTKTWYTATVTALNGAGDAAVDATVAVIKTTATVESKVTLNAEGTSQYALQIDNLANANVQAGTVTFVGNSITVSKDAGLTVSSGATLLIGENATLVDNEGMMVNNGTISIAEKKTLSVKGTTDAGTDTVGTLVGNVNVPKDAALEADSGIIITGTVTVDADGKFTVTGALQVGASPELLTDTASGAIVGKVTIGATASDYVLAFAGADLSQADIVNASYTELKSTAYQINGIDFATVYTFGNKPIDGTHGDAVYDAVDALKDLYTPTTGTSTAPVYYDIVWYADGVEVESTDYVGDYAQVTTEIRYNSVPVTVSAGPQITVSVDGVVWNGYDTLWLTIGTHTVSAVVNPGYTGEITITFNGVAVTNGQFEITSDMMDSLDQIVLSATGNVTQDSTTVITGGDGDSGMGLTDYLLIILVILIVVMAIIVALRLMRS